MDRATHTCVWSGHGDIGHQTLEVVAAMYGCRLPVSGMNLCGPYGWELSLMSDFFSLQVAHVKAEKDILKKIDFPFIVNLLGYCQDDKCVYLVLEYVSGGDFFGHLRTKDKLDEATARFYAAQIVLAFEYLHSLDIIYRDLKPENLLLDEKGDLKIADFGFAKKIDHRTFTLCGTPDYLAPEIILAKGHGKAVDWWTLGVLIYEMLAGVAPFADDDASATYQKILDGKIIFPRYFSRSAKDLIRKLLTADLTKRIGCLKDGVREIKHHPWFSNVKWDNVFHRKDKPPIKPKPLNSPSDTSNFDEFMIVPPMEHPFELSEEDQEVFADL
ncbi:hypothetical protein KP509_25G016500 [Ceratopteris richardii]|uniref:Uncharacterized protein n=1 Tax=Ceratopteris richardii TaxID=49495 RepID=A0A8T2RN53_CERRI|nr:hypothetical protein KP509_25G016500 [Ceratopteris richardii]